MNIPQVKSKNMIVDYSLIRYIHMCIYMRKSSNAY